MAEIATPMIKASIGWLRSRIGKRLRNGDVYEKGLSGIITPELDKIKSRLDGLAQQHLGAAISSYRAAQNCMAERDESDGSPAKRMKLDSQENEFYRNALDNANLAFHNTSLTLEKRISATYIRILVELSKNADDPSLALRQCELYLTEMHDIEEVKNNFCRKLGHRPSVMKMIAMLTRSKKKLLDNIILSVCQVNRILFGNTQKIGESKHLFVWPCVTCKCRLAVIDPLRDPRLGVDIVIWTFGQEEKEHKLVCPRSIASNSKGEYLVVDSTDIKVFDYNGKYHGQYSLSGLIRNRKGQYHVVGIDHDTDQHGSVYLLVSMVSESHAKGSHEVFVLDTECKLLRQFPLRNNSKGRKLAVNQHLDKTELLVLEGERGLPARVEVYETDGAFFCQFGEGILMDAQDIVSANNGRTYVLDKYHEFNRKYIREFGVGGRRNQLSWFDVAPETIALAFHWPSEHVVFIARTPEEEKQLMLYIYNKQNNPVRIYQLDVDEIPKDQNVDVAVTSTGRIAVLVAEQRRGEHRGKVIVF